MRVASGADTILNIQPKENQSGTETAEDVVLRQADNLLKDLPEDFVPVGARVLALH